MMGFFDDIQKVTGGDVLSAVGRLGGSLLSANSSSDAAAKNLHYQKEFAQNGIRWRVADAKAAGIHPLAALGAHTQSYTPVFQGSDYGDLGLGEMGQSINRAIQAKQTEAERKQQVALDSQYRMAQIDLIKAQTYQVQEETAKMALDSIKSSTQQAGQPPAMPRVNSGFSPSGGSDKSSIINQVTLIRDPKGRLVSLGNSQEYHDMNEDVPIFEIVPALVSLTWDARVKLTGEPVLVDRKWYAYSQKRQEFLPVNIKTYKPRWKRWFMDKRGPELQNSMSKVRSGGLRAYYGVPPVD